MNEKRKGCLPLLAAVGLGGIIALTPIIRDEIHPDNPNTIIPTNDSEDGFRCTEKAVRVETSQPYAIGPAYGIEPSGNTCVYEN